VVAPLNTRPEESSGAPGYIQIANTWLIVNVGGGPTLESLVSSREPTPNLWVDAWLAALAMSLDYEMTTFDRGFRSFRALKLRLLEMPDR
jgi:hypothetical protein